jgi:dTDP-D-glucose 4,6-dehydratase
MRAAGWTPAVQLSDGLRRTVDFYRQHLTRYIDDTSAAGQT